MPLDTWLKYHWHVAKTWVPRSHRVGQYTLKLPAGHWLDANQAMHPHYDEALGEIARIVYDKYPTCVAVDIGANVGDSAALMRKYHPLHVICIEADPVYLPYLHENAKQIGDIRVEACYVGPRSETIDPERIIRSHGAATILPAGQGTSGNGLPMRPLDEIVESHAADGLVRLLKTDTDGCDFDIIVGSAAYLTRQKPVLFFEYDPGWADGGPEKAHDAMRVLASAGYRKYVVFTNCGDFLLTTDNVELFDELNVFLRRVRDRQGSLIRYLDVAAFAAEDLDLFSRLREWAEG